MTSGVEEDADEREAEARIRSIDPERDEQDDERRGQEWQSQRLDGRHVRAEKQLRPVPQGNRADEQPPASKADVT